MRLLHVDSSILGANSVSRTLSAEIVAAERRLHPGLHVVYRDLAAEPLQHITGEHLAAMVIWAARSPQSFFVPREVCTPIRAH